MSKSSTPVDEALFAFVQNRTIPEDALLGELRRAALAAGLPEIQIAPEQAAFLQLLLSASRCRQVVEVGTLGGYSAIAMARGLPPDGRVLTLEIDPAHAAFARDWIARAGEASRIEVRLGDARQTLEKLPADSADAMFVDADKEGYVTYLREAMRILRPGGLLLADNVLAGGEAGDPVPRSATAKAIRAFHDAVAATPGLRSVIVPLGDGCLFGVKGDAAMLRG